MSDQEPETEAAGTSSGADFDVVIVGAGFGGMYMLHRLRGMGFSVRVLDAASEVGGTWYWNRYPGARCDVESMQYSYQFSDALQQEWEWTEKYATQPEILRYANHVADCFDLRRDIRFDTRVTSAIFDEAAGRWRLGTEAGAQLMATYCVMATGCLSSANTPEFKGIDSFEGERYHTGHWPHEAVDFTAKRVGIIGTGSSAIQAIPLIAQQAEHLYVFQRTPNFMVPAHNAPLAPELQKAVKADYAGVRARAKQTFPGLDFEFNEALATEATAAERQREFEARWAYGGVSFMGAFQDLLYDREANEAAAEFVRGKIRETVHDPAVAELLSPRNIIGAKRLCVDSGYWQTFNRSNVTLVDVHEHGIEAITADGLTVNGSAYAFDAIVFATGFDAMTGALLGIDIRGVAGRTLREKWRDGPKTYLGLAMAGFPNLFTITGPGSPSVFTNMLPSIEQHVEWIAECLGYMRERGFGCIESSAEAEEAWVAHASAIADGNLRSMDDTWYIGANIPGKPRVFMPYIGGFPLYLQKCDEVVANGYEGFDLS